MPPLPLAERTFFSEGDVLVTNARLVSSGHTYAIAGVTSVTPSSLASSASRMSRSRWFRSLPAWRWRMFAGALNPSATRTFVSPRFRSIPVSSWRWSFQQGRV